MKSFADFSGSIRVKRRFRSSPIRAELESQGEIIGNNDLWIAAHALASKLTLVTNKEKEFRRVRGLKVQNWAA